MSTFSLNKSLEILTRTPDVLDSLLHGISDDWSRVNEGGETWSPYDVVGHLIHGEKTDWIPRMQIILVGEDKRFAPFDRFAQFENSKGKSLNELLLEFRDLREHNLEMITSSNLDVEDFKKVGIHPVFGEVTLQQLLATWVAHDLNHLAQIARVMAKQFTVEVGPWREFLGILK